MAREFECRREVLLAATPEEVWDAVATSEGNAAWLFPNDIDADAAKAWEPPAHLHVRHERGDWFNALEFTIEAREGGTTLMRYMHSGIFVDDWDTQYDGVSQHTDFYLHTLGEYLRHFAGPPGDLHRRRADGDRGAGRHGGRPMASSGCSGRSGWRTASARATRCG